MRRAACEGRPGGGAAPRARAPHSSRAIGDVAARAPTLCRAALTPFSADVARRTKVAGTELEKKIAEACSNKPWGASSTMLAEIAQATYDYQEYPVVMQNVWKRVNESGKNWRIVYKALTLLEIRMRRRLRGGRQ